MVQPIPDILRKGLKIIFVGFNPSLRSGEVGHHYANPNNRFWKILYRAELTSRQFTPQEDKTLLNHGYGFTNIVDRPTKAAEDITKSEYEQGRVCLQDKLETYVPEIVCFVGKGVYNQYSGRRKVKWGYQEEPVTNGSKEFVAPSSSGLVRMKIEDIVTIYRQLHNQK